MERPKHIVDGVVPANLRFIPLALCIQVLVHISWHKGVVKSAAGVVDPLEVEEHNYKCKEGPHREEVFFVFSEKLPIEDDKRK